MQAQIKYSLALMQKYKFNIYIYSRTCISANILCVMIITLLLYYFYIALYHKLFTIAISAGHTVIYKKGSYML